jgi:hypothetical protein
MSTEMNRDQSRRKEITMEEIRREYASNENTNSQADTLIDLALTDEQADETKGGPGAGSRDSHFRESLFGNELMGG